MKGLARVGTWPEIDCPFVNFGKIGNEVSSIEAKLDEQAAQKELVKRKDAIVNAKPSDVAYRHAADHKISRYYRLDLDQPDEDDRRLSTYRKGKTVQTVFENLRKCLTKGFPVAFGF